MLFFRETIVPTVSNVTCVTVTSLTVASSFTACVLLEDPSVEDPSVEKSFIGRNLCKLHVEEVLSTAGDNKVLLFNSY